MMNRHSTTDPQVISFLTMRKAIGLLAFFLPVILLAGSFLLDGCRQLQPSLSHYYYTLMGDVFVGIVVAIALFLMAYKGYQEKKPKYWNDNRLTNLAGWCALVVALLPTNVFVGSSCSIFTLQDSFWREWTHYLSAGVFFLCLAWISFFVFTKTHAQKSRTPQKIYRDYVYKACGIIIFLAILMIPVFNTLELFYASTFWLEWLAMAAFGTSWLVKGELMLQD